MKNTKGDLSVIKMNYEANPKEIITGVGISEKQTGGVYSTVLLNTILPETNKEYIEQHEQIKADCERVVKCWNMHDDLIQALINLTQKCNIITNSKCKENENPYSDALLLIEESKKQ